MYGPQDASTIFYCLFLMPKLRSFTFRTLASIFLKKLPRKLLSYLGYFCSKAPLPACCDTPRLWHTYRGQICLDFRKLLWLYSLLSSAGYIGCTCLLLLLICLMARMSKALMVDNISRHAISDPGTMSLFVAPIFLKTFFFGHCLIFFPTDPLRSRRKVHSWENSCDE